MKTSTALFALAGLVPALAVDFSGYTTSQCAGGPYIKCSNIGPNICCNIIVGNSVSTQHGATSLLYANLPTNSRAFGFQQTRDGNPCGSVVGNHATPGGGSICTSLNPNVGQYAALSWQANSSSKKRSVEADYQGCTSTVQADTFVLADGTQYDLTKMDGSQKLQLWNAAHSGAALISIPSSLAQFAKAEKAPAQPTDFTSL